MKRYNLVHDPDPSYRSQMCVRPKGQWVRYEDFAALEAQVKEAALQGLADLGQLQEAHDAQKAAEAKLATAVEALGRIDDGFGPNHLSGFAHAIARAAISKIKEPDQ